MTLWIAYATLGLSCALIVALALAGCTQPDPSGPTFEINNNTGQVAVNITDGSSSPVGTAPCGATSSQKNGTNQPTGPDCSTSTDDHSPAPVTP